MIIIVSLLSTFACLDFYYLLAPPHVQAGFFIYDHDYLNLALDLDLAYR